MALVANFVSFPQLKIAKRQPEEAATNNRNKTQMNNGEIVEWSTARYPVGSAAAELHYPSQATFLFWVCNFKMRLQLCKAL